jgi:hypothetical protein
VVRRGVLAADAQALELGLEQHLALTRCATEDRGVVAEQRRGVPHPGRRLMEDRDGVGGLHRAEGRRGDEQPRVVVDHVQDLDRRSVDERPVRRVGLPELVGQRRLEADER